MIETVTVESDGFSIESNTGTADAIRENLISTPAEPDTPETPEQAEPEKPEPVAAKPPKPRDDMHARLSQEVQRRKALEQERDELKQRLESGARQPETPKPAAQSGKPSWKTFEEQIGATFETWADAQDAYIDAREAWGDEQRSKKDQEREHHSTVDRLITTHAEREQTATETHPDYWEVAQAGEDARVAAGAPFPDMLANAIRSRPNSIDVVYWLGSHPDEFVQLAWDTNDLPVAAASQRIVQRLLDACVGAGVRPGAALRPPLSNAKPPIKPVGASLVTAPEVESDDEPFEKHFHRENAKDRKAGKL
jgi:hypothetical protein